MTLKAAGSRAREVRHTQAAREEVFHHGELLEGESPQQRDIGIEIVGGRVQIFIRQRRIVGK